MDYKYRFFALRQVVCLALLSASGVSLVYEGYWGWALFVMAGVVYVIMLTLRSQRNLNEKFELMLKAFINDDFSFRFPIKGRWDYTTRHLNSLMDSYSRILDKNRRVLAERETFYKLILDHVNTGIIVVDEEDNVVQCNGKALKMLGIPALSRMKQLDRLGGYVADAFRLAVPDGQKRLSYETPKGTKEILLGVAVLKLQQGQLRIFTLNDLRAAVDERELDAWIKMSHVLTHEIMNTITPVVSLSASLLEKKDRTPAQLQEGLSVIYSTSQGFLSWVENYRKFSSLPTPVPALFYIHELTDEIATLKMIPQHISLNVSIVPEDILLYADKHLIRQVVINLVRNAVQAIGEDIGQIEILSYVREDDHVVIKVCNDGPAISEEVRQHIFVPFFTTKAHGSGIGLSVCKQIMTLSNGSITLLPSGTSGWNTTFVLDFA
jgi:nitrogen fixation/metabolism regulation signal transduction histidine kinase